MPVVPRQEWESAKQYIEYLRHLSAYSLFAAGYVSGKKVLEIGCGSGYGTHELSLSALRVVGLDISSDGVAAYWEKYRRQNLVFTLGDGTRLPFKDGLFDVVISFQVIEHIEPKAVPRYLCEIRRVLRSGGVFLCSTPNKQLRLLPFERPWNSEHKKEYDDAGLKSLMSPIFQQVAVHGLCSSDEVHAIACKGVKHSPVTAYLLLPVWRLLNKCLPSAGVRTLKKCRATLRRRQVASEPTRQEAFASRFSLDDFRIDDGCPKMSLDFYMLCTKVED